MKNTTKKFLKLSTIVLSTTALLISCGSAKEEIESKEAYAKATLDSTSFSAINSSSENEQLTQTSLKKDSLRAFVRKANFLFKVKDVKTSTFEIERIVNEHNGYVTKSDLQSTVNYKSDMRINKDSMLEIKNYTVSGNICIRIPNDELNKTLNEIVVLIDYLDHRTINAEDITKQLSSAELAQQRFTNHQQRIEKAIDEKGKKLRTTVEAENNLYTKQVTTDDTKLNALELKHDIAYSTITISIYQKETSKSETYAYPMPIEPYQPTFGSRILNVIKDSIHVLEMIVLFLIQIWPIAFLIIGGYLIFKRIHKKNVSL